MKARRACVGGYANNPDGGDGACRTCRWRDEQEAEGALLIGADGIHSAMRAQMHPDQPPIHWGGALMWRGVTMAKPIRTGSSFVGLGTHRHRMVIIRSRIPIRRRAGDDQLDRGNHARFLGRLGQQTGWFRQAAIEDFIQHFDGWTYDWLDVPALLRGAEVAYENPMIDREPVSTWRDGRRRAARRRGARHVSDRLQRREPGGDRCAHSRRLHGRARRHAAALAGL